MTRIHTVVMHAHTLPQPSATHTHIFTDHLANLAEVKRFALGHGAGKNLLADGQVGKSMRRNMKSSRTRDMKNNSLFQPSGDQWSSDPRPPGVMCSDINSVEVNSHTEFHVNTTQHTCLHVFRGGYIDLCWFTVVSCTSVADIWNNSLSDAIVS